MMIISNVSCPQKLTIHAYLYTFDQGLHEHDQVYLEVIEFD